MLKEVRFTFQHDGCWMQDASARHPDVTIVTSGIYQVDDEIHANMVVHGAAASIRELREEVARDERVVRMELVQEARGVARFHVAYRWPRSVFRHVLEHRPTSNGPVRYAQGVEHHQVVGEAKELARMLEMLGQKGRLDVVSLRDAAAPRDDGEDVQLTAMEWDALAAAHQEGYFEWPRRRSAKELAAASGVSNTRFLDLLRNAEAKVVAAFVAGRELREPGSLGAARHRRRKAAAGLQPGKGRPR